MEPNPVIISATARQTASLIFLHGLGDTGHGWASTIAAIRGPHVKVICPTASTMPVTLNAGFRMPSWFDLRTLDATAPEDEEGIVRATSLVHGLIADEVKSGIPANRVLLGGFSQGGALALHAALTYQEPLAGVMSLSCWLPRHSHFPDAVKAPKDLPINYSLLPRYLSLKSIRSCLLHLKLIPEEYSSMKLFSVKKRNPKYNFLMYQIIPSEIHHNLIAVSQIGSEGILLSG